MLSRSRTRRGREASEEREAGRGLKGQRFAENWDGYILGVTEHMRSIVRGDKPESHGVSIAMELYT